MQPRRERLTPGHAAPADAAADQGFVGRGQELTAIAAAAASAAASQARVVWIEGDPGLGKTALLRRAVTALPEGFSVTHADAEELAGDEPFNLVAQLGVADATAAFPAGLELLGRWSQRQEQGPVAVVIEDLQWADQQSRLALLCAVRRLGQDRVLVLVTSRPGPDVADGWDRFRLDADRCLLVRLGSLSLPDVAEMARCAGLSLPRRAAERLFAHTGGHPLYVKTLLSELSPEQLAAPEGQLPVPRSLASTTTARLAGLPGDVRSLAAGLAVINQPTSLPVTARVAGVDQPARALDGLLATGLVTWQASDEQPALRFAHPLYREAIYADLAPTRRQELHRRTADIVGGRSRLGHLVAAADSADDVLADQVDDAAEEEASRSDFAVAAKHLLWAWKLSSDRGRAESRLLRAARLLLAAEQTAEVESLRPRLEDCAASPLRALVLGVLAWDQGDAVAAEQQLAEATGFIAGEDPGNVAQADRMAAAEAWARLAFLYATQIRPQQALDAAGQALALAPRPDVEHTATLAAAAGDAMLHGAPAGLRRLARRLPAAPGEVEVADVDLLIGRGALGCYAGLTVAATADLRAAVRLARHGPAFHLPRAHVQLSQQLFNSGDWDEALVQARVALSLIPDDRRTWIEAQADATLASVLASRGDWDRAREHLTAAERATAEVGTAEAEGTTWAAQACWARARHQPKGVIEALDPMLAAEGRGPSKINSLVWWPWLITALIDDGEIETAAQQVEELRQAAAQRGLDLAARITGLQARLSAATGHPDQALIGFGRAVSGLGPDDPLLDRAELHHAFGRLLRARGDRREAVSQLRQAHELLNRAGAQPFVQRVEADLAGAGLLSTAGARKSPLALTDREKDVVALVARGMTNREVAGELYFSVKAVEYHLGNVFGKLGISSRRQLRELAVLG